MKLIGSVDTMYEHDTCMVYIQYERVYTITHMHDHVYAMYIHVYTIIIMYIGSLYVA
jgi:hypothetical protein